MSSIATHGGGVFDYETPDCQMVNIEDIAHALSQINRFTGHTFYPYSVGQHSLAVAHYLEVTGATPRMILAGLLHDAHEVYFGDINSPLKKFLDISAHEKRIQLVVLQRFGLTLEDVENKRVKEADLVSLAVEKEHLLPASKLPWPCLSRISDKMMSLMPYPVETSPSEVRQKFLSRFHSLSIRRVLRPSPREIVTASPAF